MKNSKVVVMSAQDVATLRAQKKETEESYRKAKIAAFEYIADEMKRTGEEYTAMELSDLSGLSVAEISANLAVSRYTRYTYGSVGSNVQSRPTWTEEHFVQVLPDGTINSDNQLVIKKRKRVYFHK